jgi:hypothetical protein
MRNEYKILVGKPEGERPLGRPRRWWNDNIEMSLKKIRWKVVDWVHFLSSWATLSFSRRTLIHAVTWSFTAYVELCKDFTFYRLLTSLGAWNCSLSFPLQLSVYLRAIKPLNKLY